MKKVIKNLPHDKTYCYILILELLWEMAKEESEVKRILINNMIIKEVKHLI